MKQPTSYHRASGLQQLRWAIAASAALTLPLTLAGCASGALPGNFGTGSAAGVATISGTVHGGQQPVTGATISLYTVGTSGAKSASTSLLSSAVTTDASGNFSLTGKYSCSGATQVYVVATGGNPGAGTNTSLSMAAALGSCAALQASAATTYINIDEVSSVAAAYTLAPFASDYLHVGATGSNPTGLVNAMNNNSDLDTLSTGTVPTSLSSGAVAPVSQINTLANIMAACINTTGSSSNQCTQLFNATGKANTFDAMLTIAQDPGNTKYTALYTLSSGFAPFQPSYGGSSAPNDFTVAVQYGAASQLNSPFGLALDAGGNVWVANSGGNNVVEYTPQGSLLASVTATNLYGPQGVALDRNGNVWVANTAGNSVMKFTPGSTAPTVSAFTAGGVNAPSAIALDSAGNAFVANFNGNSVTGLNASGAALASSPFTGNSNITVPSGIAVGPAGNVYVTSGNGTVVQLTNAGAYRATYTDQALQGTLGVAIDASSHVFATGSTTGSAVTGSVSEFLSGAANAVSPVSANLGTPFGVAVDGQYAWIANSSAAGSLVKLAYGASAPASPATGFGSLSTPVGVAIDASGDVWTANSGSNTLSKFVGIATPVVTPLAANVGP